MMQTRLPPEQISKYVCKHLFFSQYIIMLGHKKNFASQKKADAHQVTLLTEVFTKKKRPRGVSFSDGTNSQFGFDEEFNSN